MADEAGPEFILPLAQWSQLKGACDTDGHTFEALSWAVDGSDVGGGFVADGGFVELGSDAAVAFELVMRLLHCGQDQAGRPAPSTPRSTRPTSARARRAAWPL
jgi:hypothetical protein